MSTVRTSALTAILLILVLHASAAAQTSVGVILPLSGELSQFGDKVRQGIELARRENGNAARVIFEDGEASKAKALSALQKLITIDKVRFVIGPFGPDQTLAVEPVAAKHKVLLLSVSLCDERFKSLTNVFCLYPSQAEQIAPLVELFVRQHPESARRIALLLEEVQAAAPYESLVRGFSERVQGEVVSNLSFSPSTADFRPQLLRIRERHPDLLIAGALNPTAVVRIFKQARQLGLAPLHRWYLSESDAQFFKDHKDSLEGAYSVGTPNISADFAVRFLEQRGHGPDFYHALGFDSAQLLFGALNKIENPQIGTVTDYLTTHQPIHPAIEGFRFLEDRSVTMNLKPAVIRDGVPVRAE